MARMLAARRNKLPKSEFGMPRERKYPMPDKSHARNAKARASQQANAGRLSKGDEEKIDAKADRVLGKRGERTEKVKTDRGEFRFRKPA